MRKVLRQRGEVIRIACRVSTASEEDKDCLVRTVYSAWWSERARATGAKTTMPSKLLPLFCVLLRQKIMSCLSPIPSAQPGTWG